MKRMAVLGVCAAVALGLVGCDWDTGSDATNWSSAYNWVNFSGTYRSAAEGLLVTDYTTTPSTPGSTNMLKVANESQGSFAAMQTTFSGNLRNANIVPNSVEVTLYNTAGVVFQSYSDNGNGQLGAAGEGNVSYVNGSWNLDRGLGNPVTEAGVIRANYSYYVSNSGTTGSGAKPGSTGSIYSFVVVQQGQHLTFTDNNGATYVGRIGELRTASGAERGDEEARYMPVDGDTMIATFEVAGRSAAGMSVKIVGTFQGTVSAGVFNGRILHGTWVEAGGRSGDIRGQTTSIPIVSGGATETTTGTETAAAE
jgi:hypothetical protein